METRGSSFTAETSNSVALACPRGYIRFVAPAVQNRTGSNPPRAVLPLPTQLCHSIPTSLFPRADAVLENLRCKPLVMLVGCARDTLMLMADDAGH